MKTSLMTRIVSLVAAILVTLGGVAVLADYALPPAQAAQLAAASRASALLARDDPAERGERSRDARAQQD
jgi:hypothetical protein